jgi:hypothetical protein
MSPRRSLGAEIATALTFKAVALLLLYLFFFSPAERAAANAIDGAVAIFGPAADAR